MTLDVPTPARRRSNPWPWLAAVAAIAAIFFVVLLAQRPATTRGLPAEIPVAEAAAMREKGSFLLDVRQPDEWAEAHIQGSTLIPLGELKARVGELPHDRDIVVVCRSGNRSRRGRDILLEAGFHRVTSMAGGITLWEAEGRPTLGGP